MTDRPDIVARLRAYTRDNRPVLASDLKEAADEIERLRRDPALSRSESLLGALVHDLADALGHTEPINRHDTADLHTIVGLVWSMRRERDTAQADANDVRTDRRDLASRVCEAVGATTIDPAVFVTDRDILIERLRAMRAEIGGLRKFNHEQSAKPRRRFSGGEFVPFNFNNAVRVNLTPEGVKLLEVAGERVPEPEPDGARLLQMHTFIHALGHKITWGMERYVALRCEVEVDRRDEAAPSAPVAAEGHRPGFVPPTADQRLDDIDRRIAMLESSVRRTDRRLDAAHEAMYDASKVNDPSAKLIARSLSRTLARDNADV